MVWCTPWQKGPGRHMPCSSPSWWPREFHCLMAVIMAAETPREPLRLESDPTADKVDPDPSLFKDSPGGVFRNVHCPNLIFPARGGPHHLMLTRAAGASSLEDPSTTSDGTSSPL